MGRGVQLRGLLAFIGVRISQAALNDLEELYDVGRNTSDFPNRTFEPSGGLNRTILAVFSGRHGRPATFGLARARR